ncbi:hypothetical protein HYX04_01940 [Candidatus Woesearchaeota archaeon]|nr:hypothetical protein [Candidatus Woesearchaeota archaeon]
MGKKKNKPKKISAKKERYAKFRKEKPSSLTVTMPDLTEEQVQQRRRDQQEIDNFWRHYRRPPQRFVSERKAKSKR